ncbi:unnamed protein product [Symbiodinium necroappetens]|uniref:Polyketide synthase-like phosphopantetheine-binding domain-containing protein n=1 Tax=Symbiodinium necroappetens TaxID=1628268 RepID=A0A812STX5_9DINO|nr:unnamed protein product [Symbiodinium necroappetens]
MHKEEAPEYWSDWPQLILRPLWVPAPTAISCLEEGFLGLCGYVEQPQYCWVAEFSSELSAPAGSGWPGCQDVLRDLVQGHLACRTCFTKPSCSSTFEATYTTNPAVCLVSPETCLADFLAKLREPIGALGDPPVRIGAHLDSKLTVGIAAHPVLLDVRSMEALACEFCELFNVSFESRLPVRDRLDRADFAHWQRCAEASGLWSSAVLRRTNALREFSLQTPRDEPKRRVDRSQQSKHLLEHLHLPMMQLRNAATELQVTELELFLAMFVLLLRSWRQRLVFGLPHSCRRDLDIVGCCTNILLACLNTPSETSLFQAAHHVHAELQSARRDGAAPIVEITKALQRLECCERKVLYDVFYDWRPRFQLDRAVVKEALGAGFRSSFADLEILLLGGPGGFGDADISFVYHPEIISASTLQHLMRHLKALVRGAHVGAASMTTETSHLLSHAEASFPERRVTCGTLDSLDGMRAVVAAALPHDDTISDDLPLDSLGLDSVSAVFLQGRLSELFGLVLPGWLIAQKSTMQLSLEAGLGDPCGGKVVSGRLQARLAEDKDWQALAGIWRQHHHLLEMVPQTTWLLLTGPPAWLAASAFMLSLLRLDWTSLTLHSGESLQLRNDICFRASAAYVVLVMLQHFLHWLLARWVLFWDLRLGELAPGGWKKADSAVILVEEVDGSDEAKAKVLGVVCVRAGMSRDNHKQSGICWPFCCGRKRSAMTRVASLWDAALVPAARNQGAAKILVDFAESWALDIGAKRLEAVCLNQAAKAACWNMGLELWNPRIARLPLAPAFFTKVLRTGAQTSRQSGKRIPAD